MSNLPITFSPCPVVTNRWVGYADGTDSGLYVALGEAWTNAFDLTTIPWGTGTSGVFNSAGETVPDTITGGHTGTGTGFSENGGGYSNSFALRMDVQGAGQYWIIGVWNDPSLPGIEYQQACTGTFAFNSCTTPCNTGSIVHLPIPPDDLTQTDFTSSYQWTADTATVASLTAFCATPGNCAPGFSFTTPCDTPDPFFGTPP